MSHPFGLFADSKSGGGGGSKDSAEGRWPLTALFIGCNGSNKAFRRSESTATALESSAGLLAVLSDTSNFLPLAVGNKLPFYFQLIKR